jgi:uncharacterized protein (DUF2336 family)
MSVIRAVLTDTDVRALVKGDTVDDRAAAAHKLCRTMDRAVLTAEERKAAQEILRMMAADAAELVRRALAVTLKASPLLPRDVALRLAKDVESVAIPVLNYSPSFTDDDLIGLVREADETRQVAVARRPTLSQSVTAVIVDVGVEAAVEAACANDNAAFADRTLQRAVERFRDSEAVHGAVAHRQTLPLAVAERLVTLASDAVREHLVNHHALTPETALQIALGVQERATFDLVEQAARSEDLPGFVAHLNRHGRLSASLLLRALASGHMSLFEHGVAELAGVPHERTWLMIHDAGPLGLKAIYERAGLPARMYPAFRTGVDTYRSMDFDGGPRDRERFQERMLQRFLTDGPPAARDDLEYLLDKIDRVTADAPPIQRPPGSPLNAIGRRAPTFGRAQSREPARGAA